MIMQVRKAKKEQPVLRVPRGSKESKVAGVTKVEKETRETLVLKGQLVLQAVKVICLYYGFVGFKITYICMRMMKTAIHYI